MRSRKHDGLGHVLGPGAVRNQGGLFVDDPVPDPAGALIFGIGWQHQLTAQSSPEALDIEEVGCFSLRATCQRLHSIGPSRWERPGGTSPLSVARFSRPFHPTFAR